MIIAQSCLISQISIRCCSDGRLTYLDFRWLFCYNVIAKKQTSEKRYSILSKYSKCYDPNSAIAKKHRESIERQLGTLYVNRPSEQQQTAYYSVLFTAHPRQDHPAQHWTGSPCYAAR